MNWDHRIRKIGTQLVVGVDRRCHSTDQHHRSGHQARPAPRPWPGIHGMFAWTSKSEFLRTDRLSTNERSDHQRAEPRESPAEASPSRDSTEATNRRSCPDSCSFLPNPVCPFGCQLGRHVRLDCQGPKSPAWSGPKPLPWIATVRRRSFGLLKAGLLRKTSASCRSVGPATPVTRVLDRSRACHP